MQPTYDQPPQLPPVPAANNAPQPSFDAAGLEQLPTPAPLNDYNTLPAAQEMAAAPVSSTTTAAMPAMLAQQQPQQPAVPEPQAAAQIAVATAMPAIADDNDLIEKEWVLKAKQIVAQTSQDPYAQSRELNKVRAEYVKKRYNKDLKLPE